MKTETIEEAAERLAKDHCNNRINTNTTEFQVQQLIITGAHWQKKIMYSEEEVFNLLLKYQTSYPYADNETGLKKWFNQFKK